MKLNSSLDRLVRNLALIIAATAVALFLAPTRAPTQIDVNPGTVVFGLDVEGIIAGYFFAVEGIGSESEVIERKMADRSGGTITQKIPGPVKWTNVTLKRGITSNQDVWLWRQMIIDGNINEARRDFSIVAYDQDLSPVARWDFQRGWPSKVVANGDGGIMGAFVETLEFVHEGMQRVK